MILEDKITPVLGKDVTFWTAAHLPLPSPYVLPRVLNFWYYLYTFIPVTGLLIYSPQRLINMKMYDSQLYANVDELVE